MNHKKYDPRAAEATMETLHEHFKPHLELPKARLNCFLMLVLAVIGQRTVSLVWLARHPHTAAKAESVYRRFFASCALPARRVGALVLALAPKPAGGWVLAILPCSEIRALTMDREFVGGRWIAWLKLMGIPFVVRVKANTMVGDHPASWWCERSRWKRFAGGLHEVFGRQVHFAAKRIRNGRDAYLAVISHDFAGAEALEIYRMRWEIETLFSHLKRRGYRFEDTHMTKGYRIGKRMGVLAVAFALSYQWGRKLEKESGIKLKSHGHRAKSIFRQGLESLHRMLHLPVRLADQLANFLDHVVRLPLTRKIVV